MPKERNQKAENILNRVLNGLEMGRALRQIKEHVEFIEDHLGMEDESKGFGTPGVKGLTDHGAKDFDINSDTKYRALPPEPTMSLKIAETSSSQSRSLAG